MPVVISPNIKKVSERINTNGEIIDPKTKEVIKRNEPDYIPTAEELNRATAPKAPESPVMPITNLNDPMSIQREIETTEAHLTALRAKKKEVIESMKKQLAELEK